MAGNTCGISGIIARHFIGCAHVVPARPRNIVPLLNGFRGLPLGSAWLRHRASLRIIGPQSIAAFVAYLFFGLLFGRCGCWPSAALASALFLRHVGGLRPPQPPGNAPFPCGRRPSGKCSFLSQFPALLRLVCWRALISSSVCRARAAMLQNALRGAIIISAFCRSGWPPSWFPSAGWELPGWLCSCRPRHFALILHCLWGYAPLRGVCALPGAPVRASPAFMASAFRPAGGAFLGGSVLLRFALRLRWLRRCAVFLRCPGSCPRSRSGRASAFPGSAMLAVPHLVRWENDFVHRFDLLRLHGRPVHHFCYDLVYLAVFLRLLPSIAVYPALLFPVCLLCKMRYYVHVHSGHHT